MSATIAMAMMDFINLNRDSAGRQKYTFILAVVGWGDVVSAPICQDKDSKCPDLILMGTTQLASRVANGDSEPLSNYLDSYSNRYFDILTDDFPKFIFYDYFIDGQWIGVPWVTDLRLFLFNRTMFDAIGLDYPPPLGKNWGEEWFNTWNWDVFAEYVEKIHNFSGKPGFQLAGGWDEELKFLAMMAQNYQTKFVNSDNKCGFNNTRFVEVFDKVVNRIFGKGSAQREILTDSNGDAFKQWVSQPMNPDPWQEPMICCQGPDASSTSGMQFIAPTVIPNPVYDQRRNPNATFGIGYPPGKRTFLGGSGIILTKGSKNKEIAWDFLTHLVNRSQPYLTMAGVFAFSLPPYESIWSKSPWNEPLWEIPVQLMKFAAPAQYPLSTFPQFGQIESKKPVRLALLEVSYKNATAKQALDRACAIINKIFLRSCTISDMTYVVSECDSSSLDRTLSWTWNTTSECDREVTKLMSSESFKCSYVPSNSVMSIVFNTLTSFFLLIAVIFLVAFLIVKGSVIVRRSSLIFTEMTISGAIILYVSIFFNFGSPTVGRCIVYVWLISAGFTIMYGSFFLKMYRIYKIFSSKRQFSIKISDFTLMKYLGIFLLIDIALLAVWTGVDYEKKVNLDRVTLSSGNVTYYQDICGIDNSIFIYILLAWKGCFLLIGCYYCFKIPKESMSDEYLENKFLSAALYSISLALVIIVPILIVIKETHLRILFLSIGILFTTTVSLWVYCIPKLLSIRQSSEGRSRTISQVHSTRNGSAIGNCLICNNCKRSFNPRCPTCGESHTTAQSSENGSTNGTRSIR
eukprot:TRINITY_DN3266_c0_g1_i1.p1 TRINITY_DN3266_c0_g1~~TRINITY_DN3266_c0_g1_i1.p1  ORF type:complete len:924 (-),score=194.62 TRINITY_DN3266_c0_g1_i1:79-2481(-)